MNELNPNTRVLIVGLGLLGGSYAVALKKKGFRVRGITARESTVQYAVQHQMIDEGSVQIDPVWIGEADLIVFALYPHTFLDWMRENARYIRPGTWITDVTGVKTGIVEEVQKLLPEGAEFIAAHPMAGKEVSGIENADDRIFREANYIVVPTAANTPEGIAKCEALGRTLGFARISRLSPWEHDEMIAFLSQLTHAIAVSLMCTSDDPKLVDYTGDSFRDLTRIAEINDGMWSELFLLNRDALLEQMDKFLAECMKMRACLAAKDRDGIREMMKLSTERRRKFRKKPTEQKE